MSYLLYKEAELDQSAVNRIGGAVGGGALGYLMTRYGLGIKGVGAGLTGAGIGATLGSIGGGYLADHGKEQTNQKRLNQIQKKKLQRRVDEPLLNTVRRRLKDPKSYLAGLGMGGLATAYSGDAVKNDLKVQARKLDTAVNSAAGNKALEDKLLKKQFDTDVISKARDKLGRGTTAQRDLLNRLGNNTVSSSTRKNLARTKRGGKAGLLMYLLTAGGLTGYERLDQNPRRKKLLNSEGNK